MKFYKRYSIFLVIVLILLFVATLAYFTVARKPELPKYIASDWLIREAKDVIFKRNDVGRDVSVSFQFNLLDNKTPDSGWFTNCRHSDCVTKSVSKKELDGIVTMHGMIDIPQASRCIARHDGSRDAAICQLSTGLYVLSYRDI